jgi:hypothetical protein
VTLISLGVFVRFLHNRPQHLFLDKNRQHRIVVDGHSDSVAGTAVNFDNDFTDADVD